MIAVRLNTVIDVHRRLVIELPDDTPIGEATVLIEILPAEPSIIPTLDDWLVLPAHERDSHLARAAQLMEAEYHDDHELTATADTIDLYDYDVPKSTPR